MDESPDSGASADETRVATAGITKITMVFGAELRSCQQQQQKEGASAWPVRVELSNGKSVECDFVVSATGVQPNTEYLGAEASAFCPLIHI